MALSTSSKVARIFNRLTDLPTLPAVVNRVLELAERQASFKEFAKLIGTDPGLTAKVLKLVNSAFYSLKAPVSDLALACTIVGARTIKSMVLSVSVMQLFKRPCPGFDITVFWRHSIAAALIGRKLAQQIRLPLDRVEEAYIGGLLHACGVPLFVQYFPQEYADILQKAAKGLGALLELEADEFGAAHPEAGGQLAVHWRLPPAISSAIRFHCSAPQERPAGLDSATVQLTDLVGTASFLACRSAFPYVQIAAVAPETPVALADWIVLDPAQLEALLVDLKEQLAQMEGIVRD